MNESFAEYTDFLPQCGSKHFSEVRFFFQHLQELKNKLRYCVLISAIKQTYKAGFIRIGRLYLYSSVRKLIKWQISKIGIQRLLTGEFQLSKRSDYPKLTNKACKLLIIV